jgi:uncharacterized protein related to proFAR isomerase
MNKRIRESNMVWRVQTYEVKQYLDVLNHVGSIGQSVMNIWQAYTVGQIRLERANRDVVDAQKGVESATRNVSDAESEVTKWQGLYNQYCRDFGKDSSYALDALDNLNDAQKSLRDATEAQTEAQEREKDAMGAAAKAAQDTNLGYITMGLSAVTTVSQVGRLILEVQKLDAVKLTGLIGQLGEVGLALAAIYLAYTQIREILEKPVPTGGGIYGMPEIPDWMKGLGITVPSLPGKQLGGYISETKPYLLHAGEEVKTKEQARETKPGLINVGITQYNTINRDVDFEMAGEAMYRSFTRKLANKW